MYRELNEDERKIKDKEEADKRQEEINQKEKTAALDSQRPEIKKKKKMIDIFMGDNISVRMPKFMKEDFFEKKCKEILTFDESSIEKRVYNFWDPFPCLKLRKIYNTYTTYFSDFCKAMVSTTYWDTGSLIVIVVNSILILISDPNDPESPNQVTDQYFLFIYTAEMCLKIFAYGLIFVEGSYLRDFWNVMDFVIIDLGLITYALGKLLYLNKY